MPQRELVPRSRRCPRDHRGLADRLQHQPAPFGLGLRHARGIRLISPGACPWRDDNKRPTWAKSATRTLMLSDQSWGAGQLEKWSVRRQRPHRSPSDNASYRATLKRTPSSCPAGPPGSSSPHGQCYRRQSRSTSPPRLAVGSAYCAPSHLVRRQPGQPRTIQVLVAPENLPVLR